MGKRTRKNKNQENPYQTEIDKFKKQLEDMGRRPFKVTPMMPEPIKPIKRDDWDYDFPSSPIFPWKPKKDTESQPCLHKQCESCNGSGINKYTGDMCVHYISCTCPRCTVYCMVQ